MFFRALLLTSALLAAADARSQQKVIVVGFDGVDARLTETYMDQGKLPNLARLRAEGTYRPLLPTVPAQTPVSWSTFSTGIDPGRTGIFDFLRRDPKNYLPVFAAFDEVKTPLLLGGRTGGVVAAVLILLFGIAAVLVGRRSRVGAVVVAVIGAAVAAGAMFAVKKYVPEALPGVVNRRQGIPFWEVAANAGKKATIIHVPVTFPATDFHEGHLLSGLGVPDMSGRVGKPFYFTSELDIRRTSGSNEFSIDVVQLEDNKGVIETKIIGPPNKLFKAPDYISTPMRLTVAADRGSVQVEVDDQKFTLRPGQWSDWTEFTFRFNPLIKVRGVSRFHLISSQPEVRLYLSPINFDPRRVPPGLRLSTPTNWASELAQKYGLYKTIGWQIDTWAISEGFATEQMFWDDMVWTVGHSRKLFEAALQEKNDLLVHQFEFPDRVAHVFWRVVDPKHPAYDAALAAKWGDAIERAYRLMDEIVGDAMKAAQQQNAALIIASDHGFASYRKSVNYNTWLVLDGYMTLKSGVQVKDRNLEMLFDQGQFWENVDWSKTRAYAMGLGEVYVNLAGREAQGIVKPGAEYDALKLELKQKLPLMTDPETGERPVRRVLAREEVYRQFDPNMIPDLFVTNNDGYRVSWQTSLGGIPKGLLDPNKQVWSGDHCSVDPEIVKGIFFMNRRITSGRAPYIGDIYPTVLDILGVAPPYELDGVALK